MLLLCLYSPQCDKNLMLLKSSIPTFDKKFLKVAFLCSPNTASFYNSVSF